MGESGHTQRVEVPGSGHSHLSGTKVTNNRSASEDAGVALGEAELRRQGV